MSAREIVDAYRAAWENKDFETARQQLADNLDFAGPIDTFDNADDYITAIKGLSQITKGTSTKRVFEDGADVCVIYDLQTATPAGDAPVAEWYQVADGRISMIRVFFDARPFSPPGA